MIDRNTVEGIVNEWLTGRDYFLTDLTISQDDKIVVEIDHKDGVWIDDCVELSKFIESHLNREEEDYELEVGSAGIGQPFRVHQQYENHIGDEVELMTLEGKKMKGTLKVVDSDTFTVSVKTRIKEEGDKRPKMVVQDQTYPFNGVKYVKYHIAFK